MINEKMLEFISLNIFLTKYKNISKELPDYSKLFNQKYDINAIVRRLTTLEKEFLQPYVIDNAEKSE